MALRRAARSTTLGTPVKSWRMTRAGLKGISVWEAASPRHLAMVSTASGVISKPSAWRSAASRSTLMEKGSLETRPMPAFSRASSR